MALPRCPFCGCGGDSKQQPPFPSAREGTGRHLALMRAVMLSSDLSSDLSGDALRRCSPAPTVAAQAGGTGGWERSHQLLRGGLGRDLTILVFASLRPSLILGLPRLPARVTVRDVACLRPARIKRSRGRASSPPPFPRAGGLPRHHVAVGAGSGLIAGTGLGEAGAAVGVLVPAPPALSQTRSESEGRGFEPLRGLSGR